MTFEPYTEIRTRSGSTTARVFNAVMKSVTNYLQEMIDRHWLYRERQRALAHMFELDAETLAKAGLSHEEIRWEARLPLKLDTAEKLEAWRKLGLLP